MNEIRTQIDEMIKTLQTIELLIRCIAGEQRNAERHTLYLRLEEARQTVIESISNLRDSERVLDVYEQEE